MGFIETSDETDLPYYYNVVQAVGAESPNLRDDVMLVQYLLKVWYEKAEPRRKAK